MNKKIKLILGIICFVIFIILATYGYRYLSNNYLPEEINQVGYDNVTENKAIDFVVLNSNKEEVRLSDFYGKPIVVNFWATWCGPCAEELPEFEEVYKEYNEEVEFMMVNLTDGYSDTIESVESFIVKNNYEFPVYFDTKYSASNAYSIYSIPQTLFIDKNGNISDMYIGMINKEKLEQYILKIK